MTFSHLGTTPISTNKIITTQLTRAEGFLGGCNGKPSRCFHQPSPYYITITSYPIKDIIYAQALFEQAVYYNEDVDLRNFGIPSAGFA